MALAIRRRKRCWLDAGTVETTTGHPMTRHVAYIVVFLLISMSVARPSIAEAPTLAMLGDLYHAPSAALNTASSTGHSLKMVDVVSERHTIDQHQYRCLAQAIYFEARGEPIEGQIAVAQVVLNRLADPHYPHTICHVVYQHELWRHRCQFSFACDGKSDKPRKGIAWMRARYIADLAVNGMLENVVGDSTHYHADYSHPEWANDLSPTVVVGRHMFYRSNTL